MTQASPFNPTITPLTTAVTAGPWDLTITEVQLGDAAAAMVAAANEANGAAPDGRQWVLAYATARNTSSATQTINTSDFLCGGADGVMYHPPLTDGPAPWLQETVAPGEQTEGWLPFAIGDQSSVLLWFHSPFLGGNWADAWFALTDGATVPTFGEALEDSGLGTSPSAPAAFGETVRAGDFDVTIQRYVTGQEVFDISPTGVRALGAADAANWNAFYMTVRNIAAVPRFFNFTALRICDATGDPWDHLLALSAPAPDAARDLLPGASLEGWATINTQAWSTLDLLRVLNSATSDEPRYYAFSGGGSTAATTPEPVKDLVAGDVVELTETPVNLRETPSTTGRIVAQLDGSSTLTITGDGVEGDNMFWYPVTVDETGQAGFVVSSYLRKVGGN